MKICIRLLLSAMFVLALSIWAGSSAEAAYKPRGACKTKLRIWYGSVGWGAFVTNRRGSYCAWSRGYGSKRTAIRKALNRCGRRKCRVVSTRRPPRVARLRDNCRRSLNQLKRKPGYRAFALSKTGDWCSWSWAAADLAEARAKALDGCKPKHKCTIYRTLVAPDVLKVRQRHLKELGLYSGKIDAIWGRGTKRAMVTFARWANYPTSDDDAIYDMLKWSVRMVRDLGLEPKEAASHAQRASEENSIAFLDSGSVDQPKAKTPEVVEAPPASDRNDHRRLTGFVANLGPALDPAKKWTRGVGNWQYSQVFGTTRKDEPVCRLATDGLVMAHFADKELGTALFVKRIDMPVDTKGARISVSKGVSFVMPVRNRKNAGTFVALQDLNKFLTALEKANFFVVAFSDGKGLVSMPTAKLGRLVDSFRQCIKRSEKTAEAAKKSGSTTKVSLNNKKQGDGFAEAKRNRQGQYSVLVEVNAEPIFMLVDTGAGRVAITESMAKRAGISVKKSDFKHKVSTANGITTAAYKTAKELRVGGITVRDVKVSILRDTSLVSGALLGMTFLNRLKRFEFAGDRLKLYQ